MGLVGVKATSNNGHVHHVGVAGTFQPTLAPWSLVTVLLPPRRGARLLLSFVMTHRRWARGRRRSLLWGKGRLRLRRGVELLVQSRWHVGVKDLIGCWPFPLRSDRALHAMRRGRRRWWMGAGQDVLIANKGCLHTEQRTWHASPMLGKQTPAGGHAPSLSEARTARRRKCSSQSGAWLSEEYKNLYHLLLCHLVYSFQPGLEIIPWSTVFRHNSQYKKTKGKKTK